MLTHVICATLSSSGKQTHSEIVFLIVIFNIRYDRCQADYLVTRPWPSMLIYMKTKKNFQLKINYRMNSSDTSLAAKILRT